MKGDSEREITLFTEALRLSPQDRKTFLERSCAGNEELRCKVEALLRAHARLGNFLEDRPPEAPLD